MFCSSLEKDFEKFITKVAQADDHGEHTEADQITQKLFYVLITLDQHFECGNVVNGLCSNFNYLCGNGIHSIPP
jgi:hypothetical protein